MYKCLVVSQKLLVEINCGQLKIIILIFSRFARKWRIYLLCRFLEYFRFYNSNMYKENTFPKNSVISEAKLFSALFVQAILLVAVYLRSSVDVYCFVSYKIHSTLICLITSRAVGLVLEECSRYKRQNYVADFC